jgi:hypothetical protein
MKSLRPAEGFVIFPLGRTGLLNSRAVGSCAQPPVWVR